MFLDFVHFKIKLCRADISKADWNGNSTFLFVIPICLWISGGDLTALDARPSLPRPRRVVSPWITGDKVSENFSQSFFGLPMGKILEGSLPSEFRRSNFQRLGWRTFYRWLGNAIPVMRGATAPQFRPNFGLISNSPGTIGNDRKIFGSIQFKPTTATDDLYPGPFIAKCLGFGPYCWNTSHQEKFFSAAVGHQLASPLTPIMPSESVTSH